MSRQEDKYHLNIAGEFFVAAQLQRLGISASVTYGNAKKADIVAISEDGNRALKIEVKTTSQPKWIIGSYVPVDSETLWVLVHIPEDDNSPPSFYVMTQAEMRKILLPIHEAYNKKYLERRGVERGNKPGVVSLARKDIEPHRNAWDKITDRMKT